MPSGISERSEPEIAVMSRWRTVSVTPSVPLSDGPHLSSVGIGRATAKCTWDVGSVDAGHGERECACTWPAINQMKKQFSLKRGAPKKQFPLSHHWLNEA